MTQEIMRDITKFSEKLGKAMMDINVKKYRKAYRTLMFAIGDLAVIGRELNRLADEEDVKSTNEVEELIERVEKVLKDTPVVLEEEEKVAETNTTN